MAFYGEIEEQEGFLRRHRGFITLGALVAFAGGAFAVYRTYLSHPGGSVQAPRERIVMLALLPPPPPPPPPPKAQIPPPPQNKMIVQDHVEQIQKPDEKPPSPPASISTGIKGGTPGDFNLAGGNNGTIGGTGTGYDGGRWGWYASEVQARVAEALRKNVRTRDASMRIEARIWADNTGRITRAQLVSSTADAAMDAAISNEVLTGLRLDEAPPKDMPMPIVLRLTARRPAQ